VERRAGSGSATREIKGAIWSGEKTGCADERPSYNDEGLFARGLVEGDKAAVAEGVPEHHYLRRGELGRNRPRGTLFRAIKGSRSRERLIEGRKDAKCSSRGPIPAMPEPR